ncbi:double-strand break repair helicase AddA [Elstera sp.]|jgi:ATP-dependent helicase/nuclease subunit A|uniref:double-strand break repair helicase AddA n=1 Tax=Elstera sp. TaxID=1916664 RepID=UPI0037C0F537
MSAGADLEKLRQDVRTAAGDKQTLATIPDRSVWVAASAGTGKTTVLTRRVLRLLLAGTAPHRILCITYTKAAAAEMQKRLMELLGKWASMPLAELVQSLTALSGNRPPEEHEIRRARRLFGIVLESPGGLKIQTIHSFCQSVLARFPLEAGLPPHFQAMDEASAEELLLDAREHVLSRARSGEGLADLGAALQIIADRLHEDSFHQLLKTLAAERGKWQRLHAQLGGIEPMIAALADVLGVDPFETPDSVRFAALEATRAQGADLRAAAAALAKGTEKTDQPAGRKIQAFIEQPDALNFAAYLQIFLKLDGGIRVTLCTKAVQKAAPDVLDWMQIEAERLNRLARAIAAVEIFTGTVAVLRLGEAILGTYTDLKRQRAWLDYDDLILHTVQLLQRDGGASWVLFKLDGGLDHILIDEAQDTNPDQWHIVRLLAQEFFVGQSRAEGLRTLFVVGDAKQSIYSFQGADPRAFQTMRMAFAKLLEQVDQHLWIESLDHSFRSTAAVLGSVDAVFAQTEAADGVVEPDQRLQHAVSRLGEAGLVELWPVLPKRKSEDPDSSDWRLPLTREGASNPPAVVARVIARRIRAWLDQGEMLTAKARPVRAGDILILVRRRGQFVGELVRALKQEGVPVAGADRLRLTTHLAVMDLLALGRFLLLPADDLSLACLLKSPLIGLTEDELFVAASDRGNQSLWSALRARVEDHPALAAAVDKINRWRAKVDFARPYEFYADILSREGGRRALLERLGAEAADPIDEFLNQSLAFERIHTPSLQGFIHWLDLSDQEIKRDSDTAGRNEVRIMTVHGAKGLQAPIVFLPDCASAPKSRRTLFWPEDGTWGPVWSPRKAGDDPVTEALRAEQAAQEAAEYRRLLYVALTRAEDRLYITGWLGAREEEAKEGTWYALLQTVLERQAVRGEAETLDLDFTADGAPEWGGKGVRISCDQTWPVTAKEGLKSDTPGETEIPSWLFSPPPEEPTPSKPLTPSRLAEEPPARSPLVGQRAEGPEEGARAAGLKRGRLVHRLLQMLPDLAPPRWQASAAAYLARPIHQLAETEQAALWREAETVLTHPDLAPLFGAEARAEVPLVGRVGDVIVSGQVDRLWVGPDEVLLADFKTNRPPPLREAGVSRAYRQQMALYRAVLRQLYPGKPVRCWLIWTDGARIMPLSEALLDDPDLLKLTLSGETAEQR